MTQRPPYRSLIRTALLTAPVIATILVTPIILAGSLPVRFFWIITPAITLFVLLAWTINIALLRFRHKWGPYPWLQVPLVVAMMTVVSIVIYFFVADRITLPEMATIAAMEERFTFIRLVNVSAVNTIIYILIHLRYMQETQAALATENAQLKFSNLETRYQLLKDQVNPHFLFNALGTAKSLMRRDPQLAEAYIVRLSDFLRASLDASHDSIPLREELKHVRDYIALQQMRFRDALHYDCTIDPNVSPARLPFFSLLTLVENAIKHNQLTADSPLYIRVERDGDRIRVTNNLQRKSSRSDSPHTGLDNLRARLQLLGHGDLLIQEDPATYTVTFQLLPE